MKKIAVLIFISAFILLRPYLVQSGGFWYQGDDQDYFSHAASIAFGAFPSYKKEYLVIDQNYPQSSIGSGLLAAPFVWAFSLIDRLSGSGIAVQRTAENVPGSWSQFGFLLAACFYFSCACFLLYRGLCHVIEQRFAFVAVALTVFCQGLPLYAFRRPIFSHTTEFFLQSICVYFFLKNCVSESKYPKLWWHYLALGAIGGLIYLTRYNDVGFALGWPLIFILMAGFSLKSVQSWQKVGLAAIGFLSVFLVFKYWPEMSNHYTPYQWANKFLFREMTVADITRRITHILFGVDWGLLYTAPFVLLGFGAAIFLKYPARKYLLLLLPALLINFYVIIVWGSSGGWYGYRYLIPSAIPVLVVPVAFLFKRVEERVGKKLTWFWCLLAIPPALSMVCFEGNGTDLNLYTRMEDFGITDYSNPVYQVNAWHTFLFKPAQYLGILCSGGVQYIQYVTVSLLQKCGIFTNAFFRNYSGLELWTVLKMGLVYALPFALLALFPGKDEKRTVHRGHVALFLVAAYAYIFLLNVVNAPLAHRVKDAGSSIENVLNHKMLREKDYGYLIEMERKGMRPDRSVLKEFEEYFQLVVDSFPGQADAYGMLGYCKYYAGKEAEAMQAYAAAIQTDPAFMGYYYNAAVIAYNKGEYAQAGALAQQALALPPLLTAQHILSSARVYGMMVGQMGGDPREKIIQYLEEEMQKAMELLRSSTDHLSGKTSAVPDKVLLKLM